MKANKKDYLRVTEVLTPFSGIEFVPKDILDHASDRGTKVHKIIDGIIKGFEEDVEDVLAPYIQSFKMFWEDSSESFKGWDLISERRLYCDEKEITGKPDLIVVQENKTLVFDWKTSVNEHKSWDLQSAGYSYLLSRNGFTNVQPVIFVKLSKYGCAPKLHSSESQVEDINTFFKCLDVYRFFDMKNKRRNEERV